MKVKVYLVRFWCEIEHKFCWLPESMDYELASDVCKEFKQSGMRATLFKVKCDPEALTARRKLSKPVYKASTVKFEA